MRSNLNTKALARKNLDRRLAALRKTNDLARPPRGWIRAIREALSMTTAQLAVRFHHRLVQIHPFPNGNGRHSRLFADLLIVQLGSERFTWGSGNLVEIADLRRRYIDALHPADRQAIDPLNAFARS